MSKQKLEKVLQLMINEENEKASDLLHDIFVEKARNIYSDMIKEDEDLEKSLREYDDEFDISDMEDDFTDDVQMGVDTFDDEIDNEEMLEAEEDDDMEPAEMELSDEDDDDEMTDVDMDMDMDDEGDTSETAEQAFMDVEDALEDLKSYFDELVGDDEGEDDDFSPEDEYDYDDDEDEEMDGAEDLEAEFGDEDDEDELKESAELKKYGEPKSSKEADNKDTIFDKKITRDGDTKDVPNFQQSEEKGGTAPKPKDLGVDGPQENAGKLRKMKG